MTIDARGLPSGPRWAWNAVVLAEHVVGRRRAELVMGAPGAAIQRAFVRRLSGQGARHVLAVPEAGHITRAGFHAAYERPGVPVVLRGYARDWPAVQRWSFDWLVERYGDAQVELRESEGVSGERVDARPETMTFRGFVEGIRAGRGRYIRFSTFFDEHPELLDDLRVDALHAMRGPSPFAHGYKAFIGGHGSSTRLHNAMTSNFFVQITGRRRWRLYPAAFASALRMPASRGNYNYSYVDADAVDLERFPAVALLDVWEVTLEPGDVLYVPPWVWHQVVNEGESIGLSYRFGDVAGAVRGSPMLTMLRFLSPDEPIWRLGQGLLRRERFYVHGYQRL